VNNTDKKIPEKNEQNMKDLGEYNKRFNVCVSRDGEREEKEGALEKVF
jgi:hypothetical protein